MNKRKNEIVHYLLFGCYCALMIYLLFLQRDYTFYPSLKEHINNSVNLEPFNSINRFIYIIKNYQITSSLTRFAIANLIGNIIMFIPLGYFLVVIFNKQRNVFYFFITCFILITIIEVVQLLTMLGSLDIDDLILNMIGSFIGYFIALCFNKKNKHA